MYYGQKTNMVSTSKSVTSKLTHLAFIGIKSISLLYRAIMYKKEMKKHIDVTIKLIDID